MREIKFRFFDRKTKDVIILSLEDMLDPPQEFEGGLCDYEIMQFTGLRDKNGKEIYEGDIIRTTVPGEVIWDGDGVISEPALGTVYWCHHLWNVKTDKVGTVKEKVGSKMHELYGDLGPVYLDCYDGIFEWPDDTEVVGNIYENPELLK